MFDTFFPKRKKAYAANIPPHLIQSVRVYQSLMEAGITLAITEEQKNIFEYLKTFYPVRYVVNSKAPVPLDITLSHEEPRVSLGDHSQPLLFPQKMFDRCHKLWKEQRTTDFLFVGLITPEREEVLQSWNKMLKDSGTGRGIVIKNSKNGREFPGKAWDEEYYKMMADAKFVLCPNGDFVWTYRFFEAILCGAIPIIQDTCNLYEKFTYYTQDTKNLVWDREIVEHNLSVARELVGPPPNLKQLLKII